MRLVRQTTTPLQAHFLPPSAPAINPTPLFLQAASKMPASTDAVTLLQAISFAQRYIPHFTCQQFDMLVRKSQHIRQSELSYALRRSLIFLQKMVTNSLFTRSTTNRGQ